MPPNQRIQRGSSPGIRLEINLITSIVGLLPARRCSGVVAADRAESAGVCGRVVRNTVAAHPRPASGTPKLARGRLKRARAHADARAVRRRLHGMIILAASV